MAKTAAKAQPKKEVRISGKFTRFTFERIAKSFGLTDSEAKALFQYSVAQGITKPAGRTGLLNDVEIWEQKSI